MFLLGALGREGWFLYTRTVAYLGSTIMLRSEALMQAAWQGSTEEVTREGTIDNKIVSRLPLGTKT